MDEQIRKAERKSSNSKQEELLAKLERCRSGQHEWRELAPDRYCGTMTLANTLHGLSPSRPAPALMTAFCADCGQVTFWVSNTCLQEAGLIIAGPKTDKSFEELPLKSAASKSKDAAQAKSTGDDYFDDWHQRFG